MTDWGEDGVLPCKIWGFVDLRGISEQETDANIGGLNQVSPGIYGIAESANPIRRERFSEIFAEFTKKTVQMQDNRVVDLIFYLADVGAFEEPVAVVPNVGGPANGYLLVKRRGVWKEEFSKWLLRPYEKFPDFSEDEEETTEEDGDAGEEGEDSVSSVDEDSDEDSGEDSEDSGDSAGNPLDFANSPDPSSDDSLE